MLVIIPTHDGDIELAIAQAKLIKALGGAAGYKAKIVAAESTRPHKVGELRELLQESFHTVTVNIVAAVEFRDPLAVAAEPHSRAANSMFQLTVELLKAEGNQSPWIWLEPDVTPVKKGWLEDLATGYLQAQGAGKKILTHTLPLRKYFFERKKLKDNGGREYGNLVLNCTMIASDPHERYSPPVAVYPFDFHTLSTILPQARLEPWEFVCRYEVAPHLHDTEIIRHAIGSTQFIREGDFYHFELPAVDKTCLPQQPATNVAIVHGCRDGSLTKLVLESLQVEKKEPESEKSEKSDLDTAPKFQVKPKGQTK
jgi:hypothetical protein